VGLLNSRQVRNVSSFMRIFMYVIQIIFLSFLHPCGMVLPHIKVMYYNQTNNNNDKSKKKSPIIRIPRSWWPKLKKNTNQNKDGENRTSVLKKLIRLKGRKYRNNTYSVIWGRRIWYRCITTGRNCSYKLFVCLNIWHTYWIRGITTGRNCG
jgi:hypothetical protein